MTFIFIIFVSFYVSLLIFAAMSGWYLCADLTSAVDAYDVLGVEPGPADAQHTPLQRIMALSQVRSKRLTECYNSTIQTTYWGEFNTSSVRYGSIWFAIGFSSFIVRHEASERKCEGQVLFSNNILSASK